MNRKVMMNRLKYLLLSIILIMLISMLSWAEAPVPQPPAENSYVFDYAEMINETDETEMRAVSAAIEKASGAEIVVVTVEDFGGYSIDEYANTLFRSWGIGSQEENNGILLLINRENLVAGQSGRVRIEVGYGLEGAVTDGIAGRILDEYVLPPWETGEYSRGILQGYMAIASVVAQEYGITIDQDEALQQLQHYQTEKANSNRGFPFELIIAVIILLFVFNRNRGNKGGKRYKSNTPTFWGPFGGGGGGFR